MSVVRGLVGDQHEASRDEAIRLWNQRTEAQQPET